MSEFAWVTVTSNLGQLSYDWLWLIFSQSNSTTTEVGIESATSSTLTLPLRQRSIIDIRPYISWTFVIHFNEKSQIRKNIH